MKAKYFTPILIAAAIGFTTSCSNKGCMDPYATNYDAEASVEKGNCEYATYDIPNSYSFENVNYEGQTNRVNQLLELGTYAKSANDGVTVVSADVMNHMFENTGDNGNGNFTFSASQNLKSKCFELDVPEITSWFTSLADLSTLAGQPAAFGTAGVLTSNDGTRTYLVNENGIEYAQLIEKVLMGAVFYYQATSIYLSDSKTGDEVDNTTVIPGEGTAMEHHFDEAFGYFGVPADFPTNQNGVAFWGKYSNTVNALLNTNDSIMDAFKMGRAAISANNFKDRDIAREKIKRQWELVVGGTAIYYLNTARANATDDALRCHALSEAWAFIYSLKYNEHRSFTLTEIDGYLNQLGDNFYTISLSDIAAVRDAIASKLNLNDVKNDL